MPVEGQPIDRTVQVRVPRNINKGACMFTIIADTIYLNGEPVATVTAKSGTTLRDELEEQLLLASDSATDEDE